MQKSESVNTADFERLNPVPKEALEEIAQLCETGELFRYSGTPENSPATLLEREFAQYVGVRYAVTVNSCSSAILLALRLCGVGAGTPVLVPAFTFTAVPSAIVHAGGKPILVETDADFRMDIEDFHRKSSRAKVLLLSHMRGYMSDLDAVVEICERNGITIIEDAAHALGSTWNGHPVGSFGKIGCFSFQSNKIINAGEGGVLTTDDEVTAVQAIILSGAYERLYRFHGIDSALFDRHKKMLPLFNMRLTNVAAALARPQLKTLNERGVAYRQMHQQLVARIAQESNLVVFPREDEREVRIPDSFQFRIPSFNLSQMGTFVRTVRERGLPIAALGIDKDNARAFWNWGYLGHVSNLAETRRILETTCDMRIPLSLTDAHLNYAAHTIATAVRAVAIT